MSFPFIRLLAYLPKKPTKVGIALTFENSGIWEGGKGSCISKAENQIGKFQSGPLLGPVSLL